jgi:hypothetical protein
MNNINLKLFYASLEIQLLQKLFKIKFVLILNYILLNLQIFNGI